MKISIIVPNYNAEKYLPAFLECIINQTYTDWELLIVDDQSTDNSVGIINAYSSKDSRIKLLCREDANKGACQRRNQGLKAATGDYIIFFDSDDLVPNDCLQERIKELNKHPDADFIVSPAISFRDVPFDLAKLALGLPLFKDDLSMFLCRFRLPFGVWTNTYRKSFFNRTGIKWDEQLSSMQDSDLNIRSLTSGAKYYYSENNKPSYYWRVGGNPNSITKQIKSKKDLDSQLYFYEKLLSKFNNGSYRQDVERFGLTLLLRCANQQYPELPNILFAKKNWEVKYKILSKVYRVGKLRKFAPIINLLFFPTSLGKEYVFLMKNRQICKKYIEVWNPSLKSDEEVQ